jgi:hypothetical protein
MISFLLIIILKIRPKELNLSKNLFLEKFSINVKNTQQSEKLSKIIDNLR